MKFIRFQSEFFAASIFCVLILLAGSTTARAQQNFSVQYVTQQDYGSGFQGQITITNTSAQAINGWTLEFDFDRTFNSIWNAIIVERTGNRYTVKNAGFNATIPAGGSVSFGFNGTPGNVTVPPNYYVLNGVAARTATSFVYQGRLTDTAPTGVYDLQFALYDNAGTQIGTTRTFPDVTVSGGVFSVLLDYGADAFANTNLSLEIRVRRGSETGAYTVLSPRQPITPAPYAINALQLEGKPASSFLQNSSTPQTNANFNISGNGAIGGNLTINGTVAQGCRAGFTAIANGRLCVSDLKPAATFYGSAGATQTCINSGARVGTIADATLSLGQSGFNYFGAVAQGWLGDYAGDNLRATWNPNSNGGDFDGAPVNVYTGGANGTAPVYQYRCVY